jgi:two-component system phosphate regulon sensor histidine kinase PhoR
MRRRRHVLIAFVAGLPLLWLVLMSEGDRTATAMALISVVWLAAVLVFEALTWNALAAPVREIMRDLDAQTAHDAHRALTALRTATSGVEAEKQRTSALLEDITSSLGDGLLVVSSGLEIRLINRVARRFCGAETVTPGTHLLEILRNPGAVTAVESAASGSAPDAVVIENRRGLWEVHAFPVRDGGAVVLVTDVGLVRRAAELRRRFIQDLSHELRSPLTVLRTTVEALEEDVDPRLAAMLVRQVERLDRLTTELNELATIEAGQVELQLEALPVADTVREVVSDLTPEAEAAGVDLRPHVDDALVCWSDRRGLYRVIRNLVDNAIKYNRAGGWVEVRGFVGDGAPVVEVEDNGEGIPAGELKAVLQRFYRVDRARTPGDGGLGLGLAIVKHMVQALGGSLELDSREGVGTIVTVRLPQERTINDAANTGDSQTGSGAGAV